MFKLTYVVGAQKTHLNETMLFSTQNICVQINVLEYSYKFTLKKTSYLDLIGMGWRGKSCNMSNLSKIGSTIIHVQT